MKATRDNAVRALAASGEGAAPWSLRDRFAELHRALSRHSVGQAEMIDAILLALVSGHHCLFIGPPGCNKTGLFDCAIRLIGGDERLRAMREGRREGETAEEFARRLGGLAYTFKTSLSKFDQPEALLGPIDPRELREGRWLRNLANSMADADYAFVSEIFDANGSTLRALVRVLNEREIENGGVRYAIPLRSVFADTNTEPPDHMQAVYDRFMLRVPVGYLSDTDASQFEALFALPPPDEDAPPIMSLADVDAARAQAAAIPLDDCVVDQLWKLRQSLRRHKITASDRRWVRSLDVLRASAFLRGAAQVDAPDLWVALRFVLWHTASSREAVLKELEPYRQQTVRSREEAQMAEIRAVYADAVGSQHPEETRLLKALMTIETGQTSLRESDFLAELGKMADELRLAIDEAARRDDGAFDE